jgi:hypothetical protein
MQNNQPDVGAFTRQRKHSQSGIPHAVNAAKATTHTLQSLIE